MAHYHEKKMSKGWQIGGTLGGECLGGIWAAWGAWGEVTLSVFFCNTGLKVLWDFDGVTDECLTRCINSGPCSELWPTPRYDEHHVVHNVTAATSYWSQYFSGRLW
jgi:hypothetical protein